MSALRVEPGARGISYSLPGKEGMSDGLRMRRAPLALGSSRPNTEVSPSVRQCLSLLDCAVSLRRSPWLTLAPRVHCGVG